MNNKWVKITITMLTSLLLVGTTLQAGATSLNDDDCINVKIHNHTAAHGGAQTAHFTEHKNGDIRKKALDADRTTDMTLCPGTGNYIEGFNTNGDPDLCFGDCKTVYIYPEGETFTYAETLLNMQSHGDCALYADPTSALISCHDWRTN